MNKRKFNFRSILYLLHFLVFYIKIRPKCTVAIMWFQSFFSRKKSEIWIAFTFFEKWKVKSFSFSLFSRNEKWIDFWFHSFREVKVKLKSLEIERWNMKKILKNSRETRLSLGLQEEAGPKHHLQISTNFFFEENYTNESEGPTSFHYISSLF